MRNFRITLPLIVFVLFVLQGCYNQQTGELISLSDILFGSSEAIQEFEDTDIYELLPGDVKAILAIVTIGLTALGNVVLAFKNQSQKKTLTELVIENPDLKTNSTESNLKIRKIRNKLSI